MIFSKLFTPRWKHKDAKVRLAAVATLEDLSELADIVRTDSDQEVCTAAFGKIFNDDSLSEIAMNWLNCRLARF